MTAPPVLARARAGLGVRYWLVWLASTLSGIGDGIVFVAAPLIANQLTDNPVLIASVVAAGELPWLLVALATGTWLDRGNQRSIMRVVEISRMTILWVLCLLITADRISIGILIVAAFLLGSLQTAFSAGAHAVLPQLVRQDQLVRANGFIVSGETAASSMIGPALGGILFAVAAALPFLVDGASFAVSAILLVVAFPIVTKQRSETDERPSFTDDLRAGIRYFRRSSVLKTLATGTAVLAFCQAMVTATIVLLARRTVGLSDTGFGLVLAVGALGSVLGGLVADRIDRRFGTAVVLTAAGLTASAGYAVLAFSHNFLTVAGGLAVEGIAVTVGSVSSISLRQRIVPTELLGRVGNLFRVVIYGLLPLGALAGGVLAAGIDNRAPMLVAAIAQAGAMLVIGPRLWRVLNPSATRLLQRDRTRSA